MMTGQEIYARRKGFSFYQSEIHGQWHVRVYPNGYSDSCVSYRLGCFRTRDEAIDEGEKAVAKKSSGGCDDQ